MLPEDVQRLAQCGRFDEMLSICRRILDASDADAAALLDLGVLLSSYGFLTDARACYEKAQALAPTDLRALVNLVNDMSKCPKRDFLRQMTQNLTKSGAEVTPGNASS